MSLTRRERRALRAIEAALADEDPALGDLLTMLWYTTTAWMMWNALVSGLLVGASIVLIDGNPLHPDLRWQWQLAAETSAR